MSDGDQRTDFEVIRDALLQLDPETHTATIAAMKALRSAPPGVAARVLADAAWRAGLRRQPSLLTLSSF